MTSAQARVKTPTPAAPWRAGALRRVASICLLLGWSAFWFVATVQSCCNVPVAAPQSVLAKTVSQNAAFDHHVDDDHHSPNSSNVCHDITIVAGTMFTAAEQPFGGNDPAHAYPASVMQEEYAVQRASYIIEYPPLPPPRTPPFYLRTSRILI